MLDEIRWRAHVEHWLGIAAVALDVVAREDRRPYLVSPSQADGFDPETGPEIRYVGPDGRMRIPGPPRLPVVDSLSIATRALVRQAMTPAPLRKSFERMYDALNDPQPDPDDPSRRTLRPDLERPGVVEAIAAAVRLARETLARAPHAHATAPRIELRGPNIVRVGGVDLPLTDAQFAFVKVLVEAGPGFWVESDEMPEAARPRPDRVFDKLPDVVSDHIESKRGAGYRLRLA